MLFVFQRQPFEFAKFSQNFLLLFVCLYICVFKRFTYQAYTCCNVGYELQSGFLLDRDDIYLVRCIAQG